MPTRIRIGMVGGGQGAFIGAVHRTAATLDGEAVITAGALSATPDKAIASAQSIGIPADRAYESWQQMLERELARPIGPGENDRIDLVSIVTPNSTHHPIAKAFASAGFNVVLDKPMTVSVEEAEDLVRTVKSSGVIFAVTYNYTGYPMVKRAAELVREGKLGTIRKVVVEYHQGWLATSLESTGQKQAAWRTDPARAGIAGAMGDIGSHAENLVSAITGLKLRSLCADLHTFVPGRRLDDDAAVLLRFEGGARGLLSASQVCVGEENNLSIRVYASEGSLSWRQENPNELSVFQRDGARRTITRGGPESGPAAAEATRLPAGHPEAFLEAFANIYRGVYEAIRAKREGRAKKGLGRDFPTVHDGARGVRFIQSVVESSRQGSIWLDA